MSTESTTGLSLGRRLKAFYVRREELIWIFLTAAALGIGAVCLACLGNPANSGICVSCFMENLAGSLGLHDNARMQYLRPELLGFFLGATVAAILFGEFRVAGGSSPMLRFLGGLVMILGSAVFMGCPIRMVGRLANGDGTALVGIPALVLGVWLGWQFLRRGFDLGDVVPQAKANGWFLPVIAVLLTLGALLKPEFLRFSDYGPGAQRAPRLLAMGVGLLIGFGAQRSRFCLTGAIGHFLVTRRVVTLLPLVLFAAFALGTSLYKGFFVPGFLDQPGSHEGYFWSFLGMLLVGLVSALFAGCPFRQIILASQGNTDAGMVVLGMLVGSALVQSLDLGSTNLGVSPVGGVVLLASLCLVLLVALSLRQRDE